MLKIGLAQIAPVWLNKDRTILKIIDYIHQAGKQGCKLITFGEGLIPGYPFWLSWLHASAFDNRIQKEIHAHYVNNSVQIDKGDLSSICGLAATYKMAIYLGTIERASDRGGVSLYCSLIYIDATGTIQSVHRKLQPTYEERLSWSSGDGHGLVVHPLHDFIVGGLNCWENWMPLTRTAMYGQGLNLHVAVWPGCDRNTQDITRFIALESRSYVVSVSGLMRVCAIPYDIPHRDLIVQAAPANPSNGGSCIAGPDGKWIIRPVIDREELLIADLDINRVLEERQNFDPSGHYSRPDVTKLVVNRERQNILDFTDEGVTL